MIKAIIVGASSGIGKELTKILINENFKVGIAGKEEDLLQDLQNSKPTNVKIASLDCTIDNNAKVIGELVNTLGGLDLLIFCAGIGNLDKNLGYSVENQANKLNVLAFTEIADWTYRFFEKQGRGHFVAISSIAGLRGYYKAPAYHAAKAYQMNYMEGLRHKAHKNKTPIYISDIRPGFVDTKMTQDKPKFWSLSKEDAAQRIYQLIVSHKDIGYLAKRWFLFSIFIKLIPNFLHKRI